MAKKGRKNTTKSAPAAPAKVAPKEPAKVAPKEPAKAASPRPAAPIETPPEEPAKDASADASSKPPAPATPAPPAPPATRAAPATTYPRWARVAAHALLAVPFVLGTLATLEFIKDDAYISWRYAHNLVAGEGLVFNRGEHVEGFTNFLWVLLMAPFEALGWDLFQVCVVIGVVVGFATILLTARLTRFVGGERAWMSELWGAAWLASSSSYALWMKSGLEQVLATFLPIAGALVVFRARDASNQSNAPQSRRTRHLFAAGLLLGAACITRPELHLLAILVAFPLLADVARTRTLPRSHLAYAAGVLLVAAPTHVFRLSYYGSLVPNTFLVKTGSGTQVWLAGWRSLQAMLFFDRTWIVLALAPFAFLEPKRRLEKITLALIAGSFLLYIVWVGRDEMEWHRLYLPALPFLCALGAMGLANVAAAVVERAKSRSVRDVVYALAWSGLGAAVLSNVRFTAREWNGYDGWGDLAGTFHPDMGKFLTRHERPHGLVAFQDMGSTPYHAPDLDFLDFFGLIDATIAKTRHDAGINVFAASGEPETVMKVNRELRDYFWKRNPEWTILTLYGGSYYEDLMHEEFAADPTGGAFGDDVIGRNSYELGIGAAKRFLHDYVPVRTWPRGPGYYLALYRRRDLWEKKPREVVLDAVPAGAGGVHARFEGGLELVGVELPSEAIDRHEAMITTWWKLPGPMPHDLEILLHVTKNPTVVIGDHVPGDWMYPADRWQPGEVLEDRTLFELPPFVMGPGEYTVRVGVFRRSTGERLEVLDGPADDEKRVVIGKLEVRPFRSFLDPIISRTDVPAMRKYPDRIVSNGRR